MNIPYQNLLKSISKIKSFAKGETVFLHGNRTEAIFKVIKGEVHLHRHNANGNKVLLYRAYSGNYFAEASLSSDVYHCTAECVKASEIQIIDNRKMINLLDQNPEFASRWIIILSSELRRQRASVERLNIKSAAERIKHYVLTEGDSWGELTLQGSLSELSEVLGLSRETLYRTLSKMEKSAVLERTEKPLKLRII